MNWIRSRPGSGAPALVVSGSASAAASETDAPHPRPGPDDPQLPGAAPGDLGRPAIERPDDHGDRRIRQTKRIAITAAQISGGVAHAPRRPARPLKPSTIARQLQADQDEQRRVQQEGEDRPHREALHPALGRGDLGRLKPRYQAAGDDGKDSRRPRADQRG